MYRGPVRYHFPTRERGDSRKCAKFHSFDVMQAACDKHSRICAYVQGIDTSLTRKTTSESSGREAALRLPHWVFPELKAQSAGSEDFSAPENVSRLPIIRGGTPGALRGADRGVAPHAAPSLRRVRGAPGRGSPARQSRARRTRAARLRPRSRDGRSAQSGLKVTTAASPRASGSPRRLHRL